jgi:hypothetical protein
MLGVGKWVALLAFIVVVGGCSTGAAESVAQTSEALQPIGCTACGNILESGGVVTIALPAQVVAETAAFWARESVAVNDRATILRQNGSLASLVNIGSGGVNLGVDSRVGSVRSGSNVILRERAFVDGSVTATGNIQSQNGVTITGQRLPLSPLGPLTRLQRVVTVGGSAPAITVAAGATSSPIPGTYGSVTVKSGGHLYLNSGSYRFVSLLLEPGSTLHANTSGGAVYVDVKSSFIQRGVIANRESVAPHLLFTYWGTQSALVEAPLGATLLATNSLVKLESLNGAKHYGAVFGKSIDLHQGGIFVHVPFQHWAAAAAADGEASNAKRSVDWVAEVSRTTRGNSVNFLPIKQVTVDVASRYDGLLKNPSTVLGPWFHFADGSVKIGCTFGQRNPVFLSCNRQPSAGPLTLVAASAFQDELGVSDRTLVEWTDAQWEALLCGFDSTCDLGCWVNSPRAYSSLNSPWRASIAGFDERKNESLLFQIRKLTAGGFVWETLSTSVSQSEQSLNFYKDGSQARGYSFAESLELPLGDIYWRQSGIGELEAKLRVRRAGGDVCAYLDTDAKAVSELTINAPCGGLHGACCVLQPECPGDDLCGVGRCVRTSPQDVQSFANYPDDVSGGFAPEVSGVAHDEASFWYFAQTGDGENHVWKYPLASPIQGLPPALKARVFRDYEHVGDIDYFEGFIYAPLELEVHGGPNAIGLLDRDLNEVVIVPMPDNGTIPWLAIDPLTARLYTSGFNATELLVYDIVDPGPNLSLVQRASVPLRWPPTLFSEPIANDVLRLQGGAFSPSGTLYLVSDINTTVASAALGPPFVGGIQAVVAETGVARFALASYHWPSLGDELEGLDFWDLENDRQPGTPGGMRGQLHMILLQNNLPGASDDQFTFEHLGTTGTIEEF